MSPILEWLLLLSALATAIWGGWTLLLRPWLELRHDKARLRQLIRRDPKDESRPRKQRLRARTVERRLAAAGLEIRPALWIGIVLLVGLLSMLSLLEIVPTARWAALGLGVFIAWLPWALLTQAGLRRAWKFENRLVDAVDLLVGALEAGQNPTQALASAASGAREPVKEEFREIVARLHTSMPVEQALARMVLRFDSEGVRVLTQTLRAKWGLGGDLAPVLRAVNKTLRQRLALRRELNSHLAGAQTSAMLVALLPYAIVPVFLWKHPHTIRALWFHPWGPQLVLFAVLLQAVGFVWLRRILRMEL